MFLARRPSRDRIRRYLEAERHSNLTYDEVLATLGDMPSHKYTVDQYGAELGRGAPCFDRARAALMRFENYPAGWTTVITDGDRPPEPGLVFVSHIAHYGFHSMNSCRVLRVIDEPQQRYGFVFGTLQGHEEQGEEAFFVSADAATDVVRYDVRAFSRPRGALARLGAPLARRLQRRFHVDTCDAMRLAARG